MAAVRRRVPRVRLGPRPLARYAGGVRGRAFSLSTVNARGVIANLYAMDDKMREEMRRVVRRNTTGFYDEAYAETPVDTGRMQDLLRARITRSGFVREVGWYEPDFTAEGVAFYPVYYLFGTRNWPGNDYFFPLRSKWDRLLVEDLAAAQRRAIRRARRATRRSAT